MKKPGKKALVGLLVVLIVAVSIFAFLNRKTLFPDWFGDKAKPIPRVFGKPNFKTEVDFTANNQNYKASIEGIKSASQSQQEIIVTNENKAPVFQRKFYDDGFLGNILTYSIATDTGEIRQSGSLGSIGCSSSQCSMLWSNFYSLDNNSYVLDNASHKDFFKSLLISYESLDKRGCSVLGNKTISNQTGITFTELYTKNSNLPYYCSKEQGILPESLTLFLKAKKAVQEVIDGKNISSNDIQETSL